MNLLFVKESKKTLTLNLIIIKQLTNNILQKMQFEIYIKVLKKDCIFKKAKKKHWKKQQKEQI